jgi:hypothetical protein
MPQPKSPTPVAGYLNDGGGGGTDDISLFSSGERNLGLSLISPRLSKMKLSPFWRANQDISAVPSPLGYLS